MARPLAAAALALLLLGLALTPGCLGTSTTRRCVESVSSAPGGQSVIRAEGGTFQYSDPQGLVNSNWQGRGTYVITVENALITQTLKGFTHQGGCGLLG